MRLLKAASLSFILLATLSSRAGEGWKHYSFNLLNGMYFGVNTFNRTTVETGYSLYIRKLGTFFYAGAELGFNTLLIGPKAGITQILPVFDKSNRYIFMNAGAEYTHFIQKDNSRPAIKPNIGINFFLGTIELNYGYNIPLKGSEGVYFNRHVISLYIRPFIGNQL